MTTNRLVTSSKPAVVIDAAMAREWAAFARKMGYNDKAALWEKEARRLAAEEPSHIDFKMRPAGGT